MSCGKVWVLRGASQLRSSRRSVLHLASCHHQTGVPTGSSAADGRLQPIGVNAGACQKPRDHRVRVPHLTGSQLVPTPHGCRDGGRQIENALRVNDVGRHPDRTQHRAGQIGDGASPPTTDLVSEMPERPSQLIPTGPPATTPRSSPRRFRIAAHSMTNRSSGSQICRPCWTRTAPTSCSGRSAPRQPPTPAADSGPGPSAATALPPCTWSAPDG
jgi:hypothetical protein